jgi:hypothetical protein
MISHGHHVVGYNVQGCVDAKHHLLVITAVTNAAADQGQLVPVAHAAKAELQIQQADVVADGGYYKSQDIQACQAMGLEPHLPAVQNSPSERAGLYGKSDFRCDAAADVYHCPSGAGPAARKTLIEHCWGTLQWLLPGGFLVRGKMKVGAEVSLAHWGYNLKRALAVVGLEKLLAALKNFKPAGRSAAPVRAALVAQVAAVVAPVKKTWRNWLAKLWGGIILAQS